MVGAGVFGAWCARQLARDGHHVILIDAYGAASGRASSADHSRVIRCGYGTDEIYSRWAHQSLAAWAGFADEVGERLLTITGALFLGDPGHAYVRATYDTLTRIGIAADWLDRRDLARRFPQVSSQGLDGVVFEPGAGVLRARDAVQALVRHAVRTDGVDFRCVRVSIDESTAAIEVNGSDGSRVEADAYVLACGPWLPTLLPHTIGGRIRVTRQEVLYFGVPAGDRQLSSPLLPVWIDFAAGLYGIPDLDAMGFKVGIDRHGDAIDPDSGDRLVSTALVDATRATVAARFPALAGAPLLDARVCQYENSSTGDFIIDRHPQWSNVWMVGAGSGHGFKHGPAVGRHAADLIAGRVAPLARFTLVTKHSTAQRVVY